MSFETGMLLEGNVDCGVTWLYYTVFTSSLGLATRLVDEFSITIDW